MFFSFYPSRPPVIATAILVTFFALSSTINDGLLVRSFAPIHHATIFRPGRPAVVTIAKEPQHHRCGEDSTTFGSIATTTARRGNRNRHQLALAAVPSSLWWILGHVTLASSGVPIVTKGTRNDGWYRKIDLPPWTPPDKLFGPVWTFLYSCMGLAVSRISKLSSSSPTTTMMTNPLLLFWAIHFGMNLVWAPVFFGLQRFRLGLFISYFLVGSLAIILPLFYAVDPISAFLLVPYAFWLSFATFGLNVAICRRNPTKNGYNEGMFQAQLKKLQNDAAVYAGV